MTAPRRKSSKSFLDDYRTDIDPLVIPDRARGRPGLLPARDPDGRSVLVKFWPRDDDSDGDDLEQIWRSEIRQLQRLAAVHHNCKIDSARFEEGKRRSHP